MDEQLVTHIHSRLPWFSRLVGQTFRRSPVHGEYHLQLELLGCLHMHGQKLRWGANKPQMPFHVLLNALRALWPATHPTTNCLHSNHISNPSVTGKRNRFQRLLETGKQLATKPNTKVLIGHFAVNKVYTSLN